MAGTVSGKLQPLILPGSAETNPKRVCFSNSHFEVVIYNFKVLFPPVVEDHNILKTQNEYFPPPHQTRSVRSPFLRMFVHLGEGVRFAKGAQQEKTRRPNASRSRYILRRIIIRRCKGWMPVLFPALTRSISALVSGTVSNQQVYRKQSCVSFHITFKCNTATAYSCQPVTFS